MYHAIWKANDGTVYKNLSTALTPLDFANKNEPVASVVERPAKCTLEQLMQVRKHLDPNNCAATIEKQYLQKCILTTATKCPDTSKYLDKYYNELQKQYLKSSNPKNDFGSFVGLSVSCNKGFYAYCTL